MHHDPAIMSLAPPPGLSLPHVPPPPPPPPPASAVRIADVFAVGDEDEPERKDRGPLVVYTRDRLLALRRYGHVSDATSEKEKERGGEVVPPDMPKRGEGIMLSCMWDPTRRAEQTKVHKPYTRYNTHQRPIDEQEEEKRAAAGAKKFETSPTNRFYGLPIDATTPDLPQPREPRRPGAGPGWASRRTYGKDEDDEPGSTAVGGAMGRFQITSRTGLAVGAKARDDDRKRPPPDLAGLASPPTSYPRPAARFDKDSNWRQGTGTRATDRRAAGAAAGAGAERRYAPPAGGRFGGGGRYEAEEERTPEWMMDDDPTAAGPPGLGLVPAGAEGAEKPMAPSGGEGGEGGAGWILGGEGRDEIAVYREAMKAKDRRMRGLPDEPSPPPPPKLVQMEEHEGPVSFLLPTARRVQDGMKQPVDGDHAPIAGSRASRFMKAQQEVASPGPGRKEPSTPAGDKSALLVGLLNGKPLHMASPRTTPLQSHAAGSPAPLGMPLFFNAPPPGIAAPTQQSGAGGETSDQMNRLLGMLTGGSGASESPAAVNATPGPTFMGSPAVRPASPQINERTFAGPPGLGQPSMPAGRESRFFGRHSTAPSAVQSPVESPKQVTHRGTEGRHDLVEEQRGVALHASPPQVYTREQGMDAVRSPIEHAPMPPGFALGQVASPSVSRPPFAPGLGQQVEMMTSPMQRAQQTTSPLHDARQAGLFRGPPPHQGGPPPFWQGPPGPLPGMMIPPPQQGMQMPPPGYMSPPQGFPLPPGMMHPPPFGAGMYPPTGQPGHMAYGMPQMVQPMPPFAQGYPAHGLPLPQQQQQTRDLMGILGDMQRKV